METLLELLPRMERFGEREALQYWNGFRSWRWSYADLCDGIRRFVAHLDRQGIGNGDRLVLWSDSRLEWVAVFWACLARGIEVVPLDHNSSAEFVRRIADETGAKLLVHGSEAASKDWPAPVFAIGALRQLPEGPRFIPAPATGSDVVEIIYTSGTTAEPKGVIHRHSNICANLEPIGSEIDRYRKWARPVQPIRILDMLPLSHMFGQSMGIFVPLLLGGSAVFMEGMHPASIRQAVRRKRISVLVCVPRILDSLRADVERRHSRARMVPASSGGPLRRWWHYRDVHRDFGLKFWAFVVGGATLRPETEAFWSRIGLLVIQGYGLTETSPVVSVNHPFRARPGTLGEVIGEQEVRIADDGEILVRGPSVVGEYLKTGARRVSAVDEDGWFHTGDIGERDAEGRLLFRGRKKDVIVTADGMNVYPGDIETALCEEEEVQDATVVSVGPRGGKRIHAALILHERGVDVLAIVERVNRRLEPHQRIHSASEWPEDQFPSTASTLKRQRRKVAERLAMAAPSRDLRQASGLEELLESLTMRRRDELSDDRRIAEDLGLSSLERIDMLASLEDRYGVELDETAFSRLSTVGDVRSWAERQARGTAQVGHRRKPASLRAAADRGGATRIAPPRWARSRPVSVARDGLHRGVFLPLFRHLIPFSVEGLENLDGADPPVIFAANHASHLDTVAVAAALPKKWQRKLAPAVRQQFFFPSRERPPLGKRTGLRALYCLCCGLFNAYPLSQEVGQVRDSLRYTGELVEAGWCPLVYPEGELSPDGNFQPFQPGVGLMAARLGVSIVPVYMRGMFQVMSRYDSWPRIGSVHVEVGPAIVRQTDEDYTRLATRVETSLRRIAARYET